MIANLIISVLLLFSVIINCLLINKVLMLDQSENKTLIENKLLKERQEYLRNGSHADPEKEILKHQLEICNNNKN